MWRGALEELPDGTSHGEAPAPANVYFPQSHLKALHPNVSVVTGMRGAGKTFWWTALQDAAIRDMVQARRERTGLSHRTQLRTGFGVPQAIDDYPSKDVLGDLLQRGIEPRLIWRTVQAHQMAPEQHPIRKQSNWRDRVAYVRANAELTDRMFADEDGRLDREDRYCVVTYDALDRTTDDWQTMYRIIRGLLQIAVDMRSYRRIRVKMFLRTDQCNPAVIGDFPDASKLLSSAAELSWPRRELYGLLWHLLGNATSNAAEVRTALCEGKNVRTTHGGMWGVPKTLVFDDARQRRMFHAIAGEWMGRDRRRGFPYTWIPSHLGDTEGKVSPRSFVAALKAAAENSREQHPDHDYALHYDSIRRGVQAASRIRVNELREDYPWVDLLLHDLQDQAVPCRFGDIAKRWTARGTVDRLYEGVAQQDVKLPPSRIEEGADGVREELESLCIFQRLHDGRVNIPDVYRVGYGLRRRGGVRPIR